MSFWKKLCGDSASETELLSKKQQKVLKKFDGNLEKIEEKAGRYMSSRWFSKAVELFEIIRLLEPGNASGWRGVGGGEYQIAIERIKGYQNGMSVPKDKVKPWIEKINSATEYLEKATSLAPDDYLSWYNLGNCKAIVGQLTTKGGLLKEASQAYLKALSIKPDDVAAKKGHDACLEILTNVWFQFDEMSG